MTIRIRHAEPPDYRPIIAVLNDWWGGRSMADMLPKLFFVHFRDSTFIAELDGKPIGFVAGYWSQTYPDEAYIHFVGVDPQTRRQGVARRLYERFFAAAGQANRRIVRCVTSPVNKTSITFHQQMGFTLENGDGEVDGVPVTKDYDGRGGDRVLFVKYLSA